MSGRILRPLADNEILLVLCSTTAVVMMGHGIISPILPLFAQTFGVGAALAGLAISIFGLARLITNLPAGLLSDRYGRRLLLVGGPVVVTVSSILSGLAPDFWTLIAFRFIAGVGSAMYMTGAMVMLADITSAANRGRVMSLYQGSILLGVSLGPAVGGGVAELLGVRAPFFVVGALAGVATVWSFIRMPAIPDKVTLLGDSRNDAEEAESPHDDESEDAFSPSRGTLSIVRALLARPEFALVCVLNMSIFLTRTGGRLTIVPLVAEEKIGLSFGELGAIFTMMTVLNLMVLLPVGTMLDRFGRKSVVLPSALMMGVGLCLFAVSTQVSMFVAAAIVLGIGSGVLGPAPAAYAADVAPAQARGLAMGLFRTFGDIGFVLGPVGLGTLADLAGFTFALVFDAVIVVAFALMFVLFARETIVRRRTPGPSAV
ncbi:MAG: MFS transporter [Chloroflexi bacterium]|nr:MFS transporter [Chloroflexota bacterium]